MDEYEMGKLMSRLVKERGDAPVELRISELITLMTVIVQLQNSLIASMTAQLSQSNPDEFARCIKLATNNCGESLAALNEFQVEIYKRLLSGTGIADG